jgi:hypothetical protein
VLGVEEWPAAKARPSVWELWSSICTTPRLNNWVWTGRVTKTLDPSANQAKKQKNLDKALQKLLKGFPPS